MLASAVLRDPLVVFGAALAASLLARMLRAPSIIGFLAAGAAIGPWGLGWVREGDVGAFAELGLVLLLFTVGLELSPAPVLQMGPRLVLVTTFQMGVTATVFAAAVYALLDVSWSSAAVIGMAASPASTAIVLKQLSDRGLSEGVTGVVSTGVLLLQDVVMIAAMIALPLFVGKGDDASTSVALRSWLSLLGLAIATAAAWFTVPRALRFVFRGGSREIMTLFAVVMAIGGAFGASAAGWSPALGAAIAGMLLAATDFRHQLFAEIAPFREAFNALFFIAIGMLLDLRLAAERPFLVIVGVVAALLVKGAIAGAGVRLGGWPGRTAFSVGLGLSTISEFGYVFANQAMHLDLVSNVVLSQFILIGVGSMIGGALLVPMAEPLAHRMFVKGAKAPLGRDDSKDATDPRGAKPADQGHVIIVGYGLNGRNLANVLKSTGIPHRIVEMNPSLAASAKAGGFNVLLGDAARLIILEHAGLATARALVICVSDMAATRRIVAQGRTARPTLYILARTRFVSEIAPLSRLGASDVIPEEFETSIEIFAHVLKEFAVPDNVIEQQIMLVRAEQYGMLRGQPSDRFARAEWVRLLELAATQTFMLPKSSPYAGRTIRETDLRAKTGAMLVALTRAGEPTGNPAPDFVLAEGDVLVLVGAHNELDAAKRHLSGEAIQPR